MSEARRRSTKLALRGLLNDLLRGRLLRVYRLFGWQATDAVCGATVTYNPNSDIGGSLFFRGEFEQQELELCSRYIPVDGVVLDIGANIGLHTLRFANLAREGTVLALEPSPDTFQALRHNVRGRDNIAALNCAVSDVGGLVPFFQAADNAYSSLIDTRRAPITNTARVPCMTVDDVVDALRLPRADFVKIDVEGLEYNVLRGMERTITAFHPVIFCEIYRGTGSNMAPDETVQHMLDRGYAAYVMDAGTLRRYERHDDEYYNYLFLPAAVALV